MNGYRGNDNLPKPEIPGPPPDVELCSKAKYPNKSLAVSAAANIMRTSKTSRKVKTNQLRPYYCHYCNYWHLTSQLIGE